MPDRKGRGAGAAVGVAFPGDPFDRATWSGSPSGVARGLEEAGVEARALRALPPRPLELGATAALAAMRLPRCRGGGARESLRLAKATAEISPEMGVVQSWAARRAAARAAPLDGVVQIGTGYALPRGLRVVTFEDITVAQAVQYPYPGWSRLSARAVRARRDAQRRAYERAVACCVTTSWVADSLEADYGVPRERIHVVGVGRNHDPSPAERDWSVPRFLFVGRDWAGKNGAGVVRAFSRLRSELPEARLDVVGSHPPIAAAGITGHGPLRLNVPAERARAEALFGRATCFVMPSHFEASAIVYTEAAAAGLPSIGTGVGGSKELIGDGGRIVDPSDDDGLLDAMRALADPGTAARLGAIALERSRLFTWRAVSERLLRALALPGVPADELAPAIPRS